ncbi:hypothetical protein RM553_14325 [Zunongwangia sp. F363]|uniref:DUF4258 domain-containing protein n=1 Tax=Autumnicola tepida TaxID=3075595 RepID=A0ABU3CCG6_9FLAO|nr:DUF4258 domain-containing protein [Zunongwangia sp. F363]MDT0644011.1 hypothetical protein [Zunongwangia sp. F363]
MKLIHRTAYFGFGLTLGVIFLIFFLGGKKTSCSYFPNARVLKNIRANKWSFSEEALNSFRNKEIDTAVVSVILQNGDVDFGKSETQREPCRIYYISGKSQDLKTLELQVENCDSTATILDVKLKK